MKLNSIIVALLLLLPLSGCMPMVYPSGEKNSTAFLADDYFTTADGVRLPLRQWRPEGEPRAVIIALHGFNDYSRFFELPANYFSQQGILSIAYDQRGFGGAPQRGLWAGNDTYTNDLQQLSRLVKQRYPRQPLYLLGESMGGAIVINSMRDQAAADVAGIILAAPALWTRAAMPWYQTGLLWTLAHSVPWLTLTGRGLGVLASDNLDMLRAMGRDPLVIKETRVEAVYGLTNLMDSAFASVNALHGNILLLYGEKDEVIPKQPTYSFLKQLLARDTVDKTVAIYPNGYHMLLRDIQAPTAWKDIVAWMESSPTNLPSGADNRAKQLLSSAELQIE
jgi:acylglycerol lipase